MFTGKRVCISSFFSNKFNFAMQFSSHAISRQCNLTPTLQYILHPSTSSHFYNYLYSFSSTSNKLNPAIQLSVSFPKTQKISYIFHTLLISFNLYNQHCSLALSDHMHHIFCIRLYSVTVTYAVMLSTKFENTVLF